MRFSMGLRLTPEEVAVVRPIDMNCSKHLSVINDIWSYEKEVLASQTLHQEGGVLCTAVAIFAAGTDLPPAAAKRVLYALCREWEKKHEELTAATLGNKDFSSDQIRAYIKGLEYQMSGNEIWSRTTLRYLAPSD